MTRLERVYTGLALGETLSWTGIYDRSFLYPFWTRRKRREIELSHEADNLLDISLPFALNQPVAAFQPGPGPHCEWFVFQAQACLEAGGDYVLERALEHWHGLNERRDHLRLTVGQRASLGNLAAGKRPPVSGYDNPHYFDDSACFRALVLACLYPDHQGVLLERVAQDASITNAEDGVWAAQAVAVAAAAALAGEGPGPCIDAAFRHLPEGSWGHRLTGLALQHARESQTVFDLVARLERDVVNSAYNYANSAPEVLAITLAILSFACGDAEKVLLAALSIPRTAGSVVPLTAALCAALDGLQLTEADKMKPLRGVALNHLADVMPTTRFGRL